jgi:hypothetical protein
MAMEPFLRQPRKKMFHRVRDVVSWGRTKKIQVKNRTQMLKSPPGNRLLIGAPHRLYYLVRPAAILALKDSP